MLSQRQVVDYLLENGLLSPEAIVGDHLEVANVSRRNYNFTVTTGRGPCFLVKQASSREAAATVANEAGIYQHLQTAGLGRILPRFYRYDSTSGLLVLEFIRDARNLNEHHARRGAFPSGLAGELGAALGSLHSLAAPADSTDQYDGPPWVFRLHRPTVEHGRDVSGGCLELLMTLQRSADLCALLESLDDDWRRDCLIHFDVKWDNCVVAPLRAVNTGARLRIVDWELARRGDPCWDVAAVFMEYVANWIFSMPVAGDSGLDQLPARAGYPLERMHPAVRAFWSAYRRAAGLSGIAADQHLVRSVKFAAARLIQTIFEHARVSTRLSTAAACALQVSHNVLRRPHEAAVQLLGVGAVRDAA